MKSVESSSGVFGAHAANRDRVFVNSNAGGIRLEDSTEVYDRSAEEKTIESSADLHRL